MSARNKKIESNNKSRAIGFLGGTFDPIHFGHLRPALEIGEALSLQKLFLMPNHIPPLKSESHCNAKQRSEMVKLAIANHPLLEIDTRELNRNKTSYTIDTLKELKQIYPDTPICFIMGMDSLINFTSWFEWENILDYCNLVISRRPGWLPHFNNCVQSLVTRCETTNKHDLNQQQCGKIYFQDTKQYAISSTQIRQLIQSGQPVNDLLPESVLTYIKQNQLYHSSPK